jgi:cellulose synthase/poly-beta-1,6-N-acetylglucosamine synthase-like glycosyltransferase
MADSGPDFEIAEPRAFQPRTEKLILVLPIRVSILVTAYKEPQTLLAALHSILSQIDQHTEILVICPDDATAQAAASLSADIRVLRDSGMGKPAALNQGLQAANGEIIVMTDGDIYIESGAIPALLVPFADPQVGAVTGRPVSVSPRSTMLGYWSHLLTDAGAHEERLERSHRGQFFVCSGYLYAIRAGLIAHIPEDALAEDAVISHRIAERGFKVRYVPDAQVQVKYPTTYGDWLKQKIRSAGGYIQPVIARSPLRMRSFKHEAFSGALRALRYPRNLTEFLWTMTLFAARLHLWLLILWRVRVQRQPLTRLWQRVESTK